MPITIPLLYLTRISIFILIFFLSGLTITSFADNKTQAYYYYLLAMNEKDPVLTENFLKKAINYDKKSLYLKKTLILFYLENRKLKEAETLAEKLCKEHPKDRDLNLFLAKVYLLENRPLRAASILEKYIEFSPKDETILSLLINIYFDQKDWDSALINLNKLLKIDENNFSDFSHSAFSI